MRQYLEEIGKKPSIGNMKKTFSIVVPVYFNEMNLPHTIQRLLALKDKCPAYQFELVFVDDGSKDASLEMLLRLRRQFPNEIKVVKLCRNFGSMAAIQAGLTATTGDCVGMISADLQDPPELFAEMIEYWEKGIKAVFAVRGDRQDSWLQKRFSNCYYWLMRCLAIPDYPAGGFDFFLIDRQIVSELIRIHEKNTNLMSLIFWLGHSHVLIPYTRERRAKGKSRWTLSKKLKLTIDSFVAFSYVPIRFISLVGLFIAGGAFCYGMYILYVWMSGHVQVKGYTPIMLLLAFTSGTQMVMLGILGEYLWRALDETRSRPAYVVDTVYDTAERGTDT